jgi:hypothetical protein
MVKRFRCPVCGSFGWSSALDKNYNVECYRQISLGKAHGFRFEKVDDFGLVARVKTKIRMLYKKFFKEIETVRDMDMPTNLIETVRYVPRQPPYASHREVEIIFGGERE